MEWASSVYKRHKYLDMESKVKENPSRQDRSLIFR